MESMSRIMDELSSEFSGNHMPANMYGRQDLDTMYNMTAENSMDYTGHATQNTFILHESVSYQPQQQQQQQQHSTYDQHHHSNGLQQQYQPYSQLPSTTTTTTSLSNSHTATIYYNQPDTIQYQSQLTAGAPTIVSLTTVASSAAAATNTTDGHLLPQREVRLETFDTAFNKQPQLNGATGTSSSLPMHISTIADDDHSSSSNDDGSSHSYGTGYSVNFTQTPDGQYQCGHCNKLFTLLQHMRVHMHMHEGASGTPSPPQLIAANGGSPHGPIYAVSADSSNGSGHTIQCLDNMGGSPGALSPQTTNATYAPLTMQSVSNGNGHTGHVFYQQPQQQHPQQQQQQLVYHTQMVNANHIQTELTPPISPPTQLNATHTTVAAQFPNGTMVTTIGSNAISSADDLCYQPLAPIASITTASGFTITPPVCSAMDTSAGPDAISSSDGTPSYQSLANIATIQPAFSTTSTAQTLGTIVLSTSVTPDGASATTSPATITTTTSATSVARTAPKTKRRKKSAAQTTGTITVAVASSSDASATAAAAASAAAATSSSGGGALFEFPCQTCGQNYRTQRNLDQHMLEHTQPERKFKCLSCPKTFKVESSMKIHMNVHLPEKPFKCPDCNKSYTQQSNLRSHMQSHTENGLKYGCDKCPKTFGSLSSLKSHKQAHSGQKPHKCTQCGKTYTQSSSLKVHMNIHSGAKPYQCEVCQKRFSDPSNFRKHKSTTHNL